MYFDDTTPEKKNQNTKRKWTWIFNFFKDYLSIYLRTIPFFIVRRFHDVVLKEKIRSD